MALSEFAKRLMVGRALRSDRLDETLLPKRIALPVFASDALSSNAYATQEILIVLALGGASLYTYGMWAAAAVVLVYFVVVASYRQNVYAYPQGGGDYQVVSTNIGPRAGVWTAAALLVDYVLTVAVSISAGVASLASISDFIAEYAVVIAVLAVVGLAGITLRGVRQSGALFAVTGMVSSSPSGKLSPSLAATANRKTSSPDPLRLALTSSTIAIVQPHSASSPVLVLIRVTHFPKF